MEYVSVDRKQESLEEYYRQLTPKQLACIEAVVMDMWDPYIAATKAHVPQVERKIVFDRYHLMKYLNECQRFRSPGTDVPDSPAVTRF